MGKYGKNRGNDGTPSLNQWRFIVCILGENIYVNGEVSSEQFA
jgi:hypothetical protein